MNSIFITLLLKELKEQIKNSKLIVFVVVFLFFGFMSPISAMFMPDIIASISESQNISIEVPEPTWLDAVGQYIKNLTQMSSFVIILIYMGLISKEKETGTLVFLLVKPVSRSAFIISKFSSVIIAAIISMLAAFLASSCYTFIFFEGFDFGGFAMLNLIMILYVISVLFMTLMFSTIFKSQIIAGVFSFASFILLNLFAQIDSISKFLPTGLVQQANNALVGNPVSGINIIFSFLFMILCVVISLLSFRKWEP